MAGGRDTGAARVDGCAGSVVVVGAPGSGVSHQLAGLGPQLHAVGLETDLGLAFAALAGAVRRPLPADRAAAAEIVIGAADGGLLAVDDAQLLDDETIELVADLADRLPIAVGVHPGSERAAMVLDRLAALPRVSPPRLDLATLTALVGAWRSPADVDADAIAHRAGGLPGVAKALALGDPLAAAMIARYEALLDTLDPSDRVWMLAGALAPAACDVALFGPRPARLVELDLIAADGTIGRFASDLLAAGAGHDEIAGARRRLAACADDVVDRSTLLAAAGDRTEAAAVARTALEQGPLSADRRATLSKLAAEDDASRLAAARLLLQRERPREAIALLDAVGERTDLASSAVLLRAMALRQCDAPERWEVIEGLDPADAEHEAELDRQRTWAAGDLGSIEGRATAELPDPAETDDLDQARWDWQRALLSRALEGEGDWLPGQLDDLAAGPGVPESWRRLVRHVRALQRWHHEGPSEELAGLLDPAIDPVEPALPAALLVAHRAVALADLGTTAEALDAAPEPTAAVIVERALRAWARAEAEWAAGHPVAARRAADVVADLDVPSAWLARVCGAWASWETRQPIVQLTTASTTPLAGIASDEIDAIAAIADDAASAAAAFDAIAGRWSPIHRRGELRCRWAAGEASRLAGDTDAAVSTLLTLEQECPTGPLLQRVRRSLRLAGVRRAGRRTATSGPLSPREAEVIELVGKGLSTRDIAVRLGLGATTIETQITSAMNKLGARSRLQAALAYRELT